jgi:hypothetical protein
MGWFGVEWGVQVELLLLLGLDSALTGKAHEWQTQEERMATLVLCIITTISS